VVNDFFRLGIEGVGALHPSLRWVVDQSTGVLDA